jgi:type IV secretion system protein VirD4
MTTHGSSTTLNLTRRDLMTPGEVIRLAAGQLLLLRPGQAPIVARKVVYLRDAEFAGLFDDQA